MNESFKIQGKDQRTQVQEVKKPEGFGRDVKTASGAKPQAKSILSDFVAVCKYLAQRFMELVGLSEPVREREISMQDAGIDLFEDDPIETEIHTPKLLDALSDTSAMTEDEVISKIGNGVSLEGVDEAGKNVLMRLIEKGYLEAAAAVLNSGKVDVNAVDKNNNTALHVFLNNSVLIEKLDDNAVVDFVQQFVNKGADCTKGNNSGQTVKQTLMDKKIWDWVL